MVHAHSSHADLRRQGERDHERKLGHLARGGDAAEDKAIADREVKKGIAAHERADHPGKKPTRLKFKEGGAVEGEKGARRLDRGGRAKGKKHGNVNIMIANGGGKEPLPVPVPMGGMGRPPMAPPVAAAPPPMMAPRPPMGLPVGAGAPMGLPPGIRKSGGRTRARGGRLEMEGGAGGALGRMEKAAHLDGETFRENEGEAEPMENKPAGTGKMKRGGAC